MRSRANLLLIYHPHRRITLHDAKYDECSLKSGPHAKSARTVIDSRRHESHAVRPADRFHINNGALLSHDDAAAPHQVAHRGVRRRHPRPPITRRSSEPPRRLRRSARLARVARLEDAERLRRELGLGRRLARALRRRRRLVSARTLARRGQLAEHARGRDPAVRVEDDPFGLQQRALALDRRSGRAPLTTKSAQAPVRRDDPLSRHAGLGRAVLAHTSADGPRAAARNFRHCAVGRDLAPRYAAHDGVDLGLEGGRHSSRSASTTATAHGFERCRLTAAALCRPLQPVRTTAPQGGRCQMHSSAAMQSPTGGTVPFGTAEVASFCCPGDGLLVTPGTA